MDGEPQGAWIFVSHSNLDIERVRKVRNFLEGEGHKPLLFFLKCLHDKDARLPPLLHDEIMERTWFVLCKSDHSEASRWVREEIAIVMSKNQPETYAIIDLAKDLEPDLDGIPKFVVKLRPLLKRATVFLSYARNDVGIARQIHDALIAQDYRAFLDEWSLSPGVVWKDQLHAALEEALQHGFVLLLLSPDYLSSEACRRERELAFTILGSRPLSNLVPVIVRDPTAVRDRLPRDLQSLQCVDVTKGSIYRNILELLHHLKERPMA